MSKKQVSGILPTKYEGPKRKDILLGDEPIIPNTGLTDVSPNRNVLERALYSEPTGSQTAYGRTPSSVNRIIGDMYHPEFDPEYNASLLAQQQTNAGQLVGAINQALVGEIIGGTIQAVGYLTDFQSFADIATGTERDWGNAISDFGIKMKESARETTPIYIDPNQNDFAPGRWSWWMSNAPSIASTLSLLIPAAGVVRGVSTLGKMAGVGFGSKGFAKMMGNVAAKYGDDVARIMMKGSEAFATGVGQALVSRHAENMMEASGVHQEILQNGGSIEDAAIAAANSYKKQWLLLAQDIPQYMLFNKLAGKGASAATKSRSVASFMGYDPNKVFVNKGVSVLKSMLGEAGEEAYQFLVNEQSKLMAEHREDPAMKHSLLDVLKREYDNGELYTSAWFGALGAGAMMGTGALMNRGKQVKAEEAQVNDLKNTGIAYNQAYQTYSDAVETGDPIQREQAWNDAALKIGMSSVAHGTTEHAKEMIRQIADPENNNAFQRFGVPEEAGGFLQQNPEKAEELIADIDRVIQLNERFNREVQNNKKIKKEDKPKMARLLTENQFLLDKTAEQLQQSEQRIAETQDAIEGFAKAAKDGTQPVSPTGQKLTTLDLEVNSLNKVISFLEKRSKDENRGDKEKAMDELLVEMKKAERDEIEKEIAEEEANYSKEEKKVDNQIKAGLDMNQVEAHVAEIQRNKYIKTSLDQLKKDQEYYRSGADLSSAKEKADHVEFTKEDTVDESTDPVVDDVVSFIDEEGNEVLGVVDSFTLVEEDMQGKEVTPSGMNGDNIYRVLKIGEDGKLTDEIVEVRLRDITLEDKRRFIEDHDNIVDPLSSEEETFSGIYKARDAALNRGSVNPITNLSYSHVEKDKSHIEIRSEKLNKVLSDPKTDLSEVYAEYDIDVTDPTTKTQINTLIKKYLKLKPALQRLQNGKHTAADIDQLLKINSGEKYVDFVDIIKVVVRLRTKDGKPLVKGITRAEENQILLHQVVPYQIVSNPLDITREELAHIRIPKRIQVEEKKRPGAILEYKKKKLEEIRQARAALLAEILQGRAPVSKGLRVGRGAPLTETGAENNVAKQLGVKADNVSLGIVKSGSTDNYSGEMHTGRKLHEGAGYTTPGSVHAITNKTVNGEEYALKLNKAKLDNERADILFDAFRILGLTSLPTMAKKGTPGGRYFAQFQKGDTRVEGLSVGQLVDLLVVHGKELTDPNSTSFKQRARTERHLQVLANKRLYLETDRISNKVFLVYGNNPLTNEGFRIDLTEKHPATIEANKKSFINWATKHKNYAVHLMNNSLDLELNSDFLNNRAFRIGSKKPMVREKGKGYNSFLIDNQIIHTDAKVNPETGLVFHAPTLDLGLYNTKGALSFRTKKTKSIIPADPAPKEKVEKTVEKVEPTDQAEVDKAVADGLEETGEKTEGGEPVFEKKSTENTEDTTPTEAPEDIPDVDDLLSNFQGDTDSFFSRPANPAPYVFQNLERELAWVAQKVNLKGDDVKIVKKLGELVRQGKENFGLFSKNGVLLYEAAEEGTIYHEAFHRVSLLYLSEGERNRLYRAAKAFYKKPDATNREVEELLAEGFREYVINREQNKKTTVISQIANFFKELYETVRAFFVGRNKLTNFEIDSIYKEIYRGRFRFSKPTLENIQNLGNDEYSRGVGGREFSTFATRKQVSSVVKSLANRLLLTNEVNDLNHVKNIRWEPLFRDVEILIKAFDKKLLDKSLKDKQKVQLERRRDMFKEVLADMELDNKAGDRSVFLDKVRSYLKDMGISNRLEEQEVTEDPNQDEDVVGGFKLDKRSSWEVSTKDNAMASVKYMIATLFEGAEVDPITGLRDYVDFNKVWYRIYDRVHMFDTVQDMIDELNEYGSDIENGYPYIQLAHTLENSSEIVKNQFLTTFRKHRHSFVTFLFKRTKDGYRMSMSDNSTDNLHKNTVRAWNEIFYFDPAIINTDKNGNKTLSKYFFTELLGKYKDVVDEVEIAKEEGDITFETEDRIVTNIVDVLADLHIVVDKDTVYQFINSKPDDTALAKMQAAVVDLRSIFEGKMLDKAKGEEVQETIPTLFLKNPVINELSRIYIKAHPEKREHMILGANNNKYFAFAGNNMITDIVRRIKNKDQYVANKASKIYNRGSLIYEQLLDPAKRDGFNLFTFSKLADSAGRDKGRDFVGITRLEDYLVKMSAILNGHLIMPVLADRKQYYIIDGIEGYKETVSGLEEVEGTMEYNFSPEVLDRFYRYYLDEKDRIKAAKDLRKEYLNEKDETKKNDLKKKLIKNYHYTGNFNVNSKQANAYDFVHFKGFKLNASMSEIKSKINDLLSDYVNKEVQFAAQIDAITKDGNELSVKTMDGSLIQEAEAELGTSEALQRAFGDFVVNNMVSIIESEKVFFGDPAFFKQNKEGDGVTEDMYKRWFGPGSTGQNLAETTESYPNNYYNVVTLNTQGFKTDYYDALHAKQQEMYERFLKNKKGNENKTAEEIEKEAAALATTALDAYNKVDPTDGMVFISNEMYRSVAIRIGEWNDDKQKAYDLLTSGKDLTTAEEIAATNLVLQPLKLVYIGKDEQGDIDGVVYDKMSMATLFRRSIEGTHLEELMDNMEREDNPVDAYKFDSAVKIGGRVGVDLFKDAQKRDETNDLSDAPVFKQYFENLKYQVVTDPHEETSIPIGTQMFKIAMMNIQKEIQYGEFGTGQQLLEAITNARAAVSDIGVEEVKSKFGFENGQINDENLISLLRKDAEQAGKSDDFTQSLKLDENKKQYLQLDSFPDRRWVYSRIVSLINKKTVDLEMPGGQLIQVSDYGRSSIKTNEELAFIHANRGSTEIFEMEARVSVGMFKRLIPKELTTFAQKKQFLENKINLLGYRIPTQGQNSIVRLKVIEVLPEQAGDVIHLPLEFTALTGSDFDIDKLFVAGYNYTVDQNTYALNKIPFLTGDKTLAKRYELKKKEWEKIYKGKKPYMSKEAFSKLSIEKQNTKKANQNRILDGFYTILGHEEHFLESTTPLGRLTGKLEAKAEKYERSSKKKSEVKLKALESTTPSFQANLKFIFTGSKAGVGPFALSNAHHSLTQMAGVKYNTTLDFGFNEKGILALDRYRGEDGVLIADWLSALIDAHVDAVKNPYIIKLNVNEATYDVVNYMLRIGVGEDTFAFLSQPIIKEYAEEFFNANGKITAHDTRLSNAEDAAFDFILNRWLTEYGLDEQDILEFDLAKSELDKIPLTETLNKIQLTKDISSSQARDRDFLLRQINALHHFRAIAEEARDLKNLVMASRIDTKKYGATPTELMHFLNQIKAVESSTKWVNLEKLIKSDGVAVEGGTMLTPLLRNSILFGLDMMGSKSIYASKGFANIFWELLKTIPNGRFASKSTINELTEELYSYFAGQFFADNKDGMGLSDPNKYRNLLKHPTKSIFARLTKIKAGKHKYSKELEGNKIIDSFTIDHMDGVPFGTFLRLPTKTMKDKWETDDYVDDFNELFTHKDKSIRDLARHLFIHAFYTSGFRNRFFSYNGYLPLDVFKEIEGIDANGERKKISFDEYMKKLRTELNGELFAAHLLKAKKEIFTNNWFNSNLVPEVSADNLTTTFEKNNEAVGFVLNLKEDKKTSIGKNAEGYRIYSPYVTMNYYGQDLLLEYAGLSKSNAVYRIVRKKGFQERGLVLKEYGIESERSVIDPLTKQAEIQNRDELNALPEDQKRDPFNWIYTVSEAEFVNIVRAENTSFNHIPFHEQLVTEYMADMDSFNTDFRTGFSQQEKDKGEEIGNIC